VILEFTHLSYEYMYLGIKNMNLEPTTAAKNTQDVAEADFWKVLYLKYLYVYICIYIYIYVYL
jgi:hypothetical protein